MSTGKSNSRRRLWCISRSDLSCLKYKQVDCATKTNSCHRDHGWPQVYSTEQSNSSGRLWWLTSVSRSVSSREVRLHDQDELDWTLPYVHSVCPVKCREVTVKKKRVETFRNIRYGDGRIIGASLSEPHRGTHSCCAVCIY